MPDVLFSVPSNLIDGSNHLICHLIASSVSPNTLSFPLHHYVCFVLYINDQKNQPDTETYILQVLSLGGPVVPSWTFASSVALFHSFMFLDV